MSEAAEWIVAADELMHAPNTGNMYPETPVPQDKHAACRCA